jgi:hypothetical protein
MDHRPLQRLISRVALNLGCPGEHPSPPATVRRWFIDCGRGDPESLRCTAHIAYGRADRSDNFDPEIDFCFFAKAVTVGVLRASSIPTSRPNDRRGFRRDPHRRRLAESMIDRKNDRHDVLATAPVCSPSDGCDNGRTDAGGRTE